jgi:ferredoxin
MADERIEDLKPHDRRVFFLQGFLRALRPVADYVEKRLPVPRIRTVIRPPGALAEDDFLDTCHRCGNCVEACSAGAIRQMQSDDADPGALRPVRRPIVHAGLYERGPRAEEDLRV